MRLYVNGDSHTAAAECVNNHAFAEDDGALYDLGRAPHPDNLAHSWGKKLADRINYDFVCEAESASSNDRIIRTTKEYLEWVDTPDLIIIQWSTWEREEWLIDGIWYQINASGIDDVPDSHHDSYKEYVANVDWVQKTLEAHEKIYNFHNWLSERDVNHVFFNGNNTFDDVINRKHWSGCYLEPYDSSFDHKLRDQFDKRNGGYHYGPDAHKHWADYMYMLLVDNKHI